jgi:hypothetical protein
MNERITKMKVKDAVLEKVIRERSAEVLYTLKNHLKMQ